MLILEIKWSFSLVNFLFFNCLGAFKSFIIVLHNKKTLLPLKANNHLTMV